MSTHKKKEKDKNEQKMKKGSTKSSRRNCGKQKQENDENEENKENQRKLLEGHFCPEICTLQFRDFFPNLGK